MTAILFNYQFLSVAIGVSLLALAAASIGSLNVLTKQSLVGDAMGHASYPGVILTFILFKSRHPYLLMLGALVAGLISYYLVQFISDRSPHSKANALTLVSTSCFGLGMVLKNHIQGHPAFAKSAQAGLQTYLFGQAAFIKWLDIYLIAGLALICLSLFIFYYRAYQIYLFDAEFAQTIGLPIKHLQRLSLFLTVTLIAIGLKLVGAILMSAFLITPSLFGLLLGKNYRQTLIYASSLTCGAAWLGTYISSIVPGLATGPTIIILMSSATLIIYFSQTLATRKKTLC